jgi:hypothetical protein
MFKYSKSFESSMEKLLLFIIIAVVALGMIGTTAMIGLRDSHATKTLKQSQQPSEDATARPERQSQQPSEAPGATTVRPDRQSQFSPEQQEEDGINAAIEQKDEQFRDVLQEENDGDNENDENTGGNEDQIGRVEIDKKAPIAISGDNVYIVWFNDQNTPNNNSEVLFRSSNDGGITFADKINLSNTTTTDSINAEIAADGNTVIITWWERNSTSQEPLVRASTDNGATFGPILRLAPNGTLGS